MREQSPDGPALRVLPTGSPADTAGIDGAMIERIAQSIEMGLVDQRGGPLQAVPRRSAKPTAQVLA